MNSQGSVSIDLTVSCGTVVLSQLPNGTPCLVVKKSEHEDDHVSYSSIEASDLVVTVIWSY